MDGANSSPLGLDPTVAVYAELPTIECQGLCHECCHSVGMEPHEQATIAQHGVDLPLAGFFPDGCPALTEDKRCSVYAVRPTICRLWGVVESMVCQYGCRPTTYLTDAEGHRALARVRAAGLAARRAAPRWPV
jgi:Fe-S-cluster containining protein